MGDLFLHIGPMKTGSTWLQRAFAMNHQILASHGIRYPLVDDAGAPPDPDRMVPSGNGRTLLLKLDSLPAVLRSYTNGEDSVLFSSEIMFNQLLPARMDWLGGRRAPIKDLARITAAARSAGLDGVRVLAFARAPVSHAESLWQQRVKGPAGETRDLETYALESFHWPEMMARTLGNLAKESGVELTLHAYDVHRNALLDPVEQWLNLPPFTLTRPEQESVNRSLTRGEVQLQLAMNRALGPSGDIFAQRLVSRLPDIPADPLTLAPDVASLLVSRDSQFFDAIDGLLTDGERVERQEPRSLVTGPAGMSQQQFAVIADGFAEYLAEVRRGHTQAERKRRAGDLARRLMRKAKTGARRLARFRDGIRV